MEKEQGSFKSQDCISEVVTGDQSPTFNWSPNFSSTSFDADFSVSGPESLRSFRVMEGMRFTITILPKGNLISQTREAEQSE